jgi:hypothetical protein
MQPTKQPSPVGQGPGNLRDAEAIQRAILFDREMVDAHLRADRTKRRPLARRWRISQILCGYLKPWHTQRMIYDDLLESGADDDRVLAIAENHVFYVRRRIAERRELPTPAAALRIVAKEVGEATVAQIIADQDPTPTNRLRAEAETRDAMRAKETFLMSLYHQATHACATALGRVARDSGVRTW